LNAPTPYLPLAASSSNCRIDTNGIYEFSSALRNANPFQCKLIKVELL
jgi:hypothetical protein